jgi:hypothetical protein
MSAYRTVVVALALAAVFLSTFSTNADTFTLAPLSPTLPLVPAIPADLLWDIPGIPAPGAPPPPSVGKPFAGLGGMGLLFGDVVDAISDGLDPVSVPHTDYWSVTPGSVGAPGTGVFIESTVLDTPPGFTPGHAGDIFISGVGVPAANILAPAGLGWTLGSTTGDEFNAGLITPTPPGDNVNAYDLALIGPGMPVLFSLAPLSPTLGFLGATPGDILGVGGPYGPAPIIVIPAALLGLPVGADIDALAIAGLPPPLAPIAAGSIEYSLTALTAPLVPASLGSGATILGLAYIPGPFPIGPTPVTVHTPAALGLLPTDDLDALDVGPIVPEPGSIVLLGLGMLGLAGCAGRRRRRVA